MLFSYACILIGQVFICRYIFMAMYSFINPSWGAFDKLGCATGEKCRITLLQSDVMWRRGCSPTQHDKSMSDVCHLLFPQYWQNRACSTSAISNHMTYTLLKTTLRNDPYFNIYLSPYQRRTGVLSSCAEYCNIKYSGKGMGKKTTNKVLCSR
jgi:hypothetical protein